MNGIYSTHSGLNARIMYTGIAIKTNGINIDRNACIKKFITGSNAPNIAITVEGTRAIATKKNVGSNAFDVVSISSILLSFFMNTMYASPRNVAIAIHGRNEVRELGIVIACAKTDVIFSHLKNS